jgi:CheY-like chemotaxis protein
MTNEPKPNRVLVVEDECLIRTCLAEGLADAGYEVTTADNGAEALERIREVRPDAVLLDLLMPVMDGLAFLHQRHSDPRLAGVPVVVLSAGGVSALRDASALRATAVLSKPIDLDVLAAVLEHVLRESTSSGQGFAGGDGPHGLLSSQQPVGICPICGCAPSVHVEGTLDVGARIREIHAARRTHVLSHAARDIARVALRTRLLELSPDRRTILADWVYRELRQEWGDQDRRGVHSIDEALDAPALHRLWHEVATCGYTGCLHDSPGSR